MSAPQRKEAQREIYAQRAPLAKALRKGYLMIPAQVISLARQKKLSGLVQRTALDMIAFATWSCSRDEGTPAPEYGEVPAKELALNADCSIKQAEDVLQDTCERGLAERIRDPHDKRKWLYRIAENWNHVKPHTPKLVKKQPLEDANVTDISEGRAEIEERELAAAFTAPSRVEITTEPVVVLPGTSSRPVPISTAIRSVVYRHEWTEPHSVTLHSEKGVLFVSSTRASRAAPAAPGGKYPNSSGGNFTSKSGEGNLKNTRTAVRVSPDDSESFQQDERVEILASKFGPWFASTFKKDLDLSFIHQILSRLSAKAPIDGYVSRCKEEVKELQRRGKAFPRGLCLNWADDERKAPGAHLQERAATAGSGGEPPPKLSPFERDRAEREARRGKNH